MRKDPGRSAALGRPDDFFFVRDTTIKLLAYCQANDWAGYDPYDALNSRLFQALPFLNFKLARFAFIQGIKRCPINLRPLLRIPKTPNPKGIALILASLVKLSKIGFIEESEMIGSMADKLLGLKSPNVPFVCWGYNFDWQTRSELVPRGSPNIICTTFAANALLDAYEYSKNTAWLEAAMSSAEFILNVLFWQESETKAFFCYTPLERLKIHNANLLGAALLCRVSLASGQRKFFDPALDATRFSVGKQHEDGSWNYGESPSQRWIDNFHTGYNLVALRRIIEYSAIGEFDTAVRKGFEFYRTHFFREDGAPRYFHQSTYPIDIHSVAQSIITLLEFGDLSAENVELAHSVFRWAMAHMWDDRGFFYYQKRPYFTVRIPFLRWSEAWMLLAQTSLLAGGSANPHG
jgi:hypothetical protein